MCWISSNAKCVSLVVHNLLHEDHEINVTIYERIKHIVILTICLYVKINNFIVIGRNSF